MTGSGEMERATITCNLCGGDEVSVLSRVSRSGTPLRSVCCRGCGLVWSDPRAHDPRRFYAEDYRLAYKRSFEPRRKHVLRAGQVALDRFSRVRRWIAPAGLRVLDVGSGGGEFAYLMQRLGHAVTGIEPNRGYGDYSRREYGLHVIEGFAGDGAIDAERFDLATIWHVLEHTEDPCAVLRQLRDALTPAGTLVVEVPNVEATCQSPRSSFHEAHLYTFSPATLRQMAAKAGLEVLELALSADGGNITAVMRPRQPAAVPPSEAGWTLAGEHQRIGAIVRGHTALRHALSVHPWRRLAGRLARAAAEGWATRDGATGRRLLDRLYEPLLAPSAQRSPAGRPARRWPRLTIAATAAAYALAVLAEELLIDRPLPASISDQHPLLVYGAMQLVVGVGLAVLLMRGPALSRTRIAALLAPLALVPVVF